MTKLRLPQITSILLCVAMLLTLPSCNKRDIHQVIREMAEMPVDTAGFKTEHIETNDFSWVEVDCFAEVIFQQLNAGEASSITLKSSQEVLDHVKVRVEDGKLRLSINGRYRMPEKAIVVAEIKTPIVNKFVMNGVKCLKIDTLLLNSPLEIEMDGVGSLIANKITSHENKLLLNGDGYAEIKNIETGNLQIALNGGGGAKISGESKSVVALLQGCGNMDFSGLISETEIVQTINGDGKITVPVVKNVNN